MQINYSTSSLPNSIPIFVTEGSVEQRMLDPKYYRIVGSLGSKNALKSAMSSISTPRNQFIDEAVTKDKNTNLTPQEIVIALDDITIFSGPTYYADGANKKYNVTFKINNPKQLKVKDVEYRIAEA